MPKGSKHHTLHLEHMTDNVLGRLVRAGLLTLTLDKAREGRVVAEVEADEAEQQRLALLAADREARQVQEAFVLPGLIVKGVTIPLLDLTEKSLGEAVPAKARSAYNRARHREGLDLLDPDTTTWEVLRAEHLRLAALPTDTSGDAVQITALVDPDAPARQRKIDALVETLGCSPSYADALLTRISK